MKKMPILRYNDLRDLMVFNHRHYLNGVVVNDAALEVMLRIEKTMQRLKVMGDDEQRWLWIKMKAPAKRYRFDNADANGYYWYSVCTAKCKDFHHLLIGDGEWNYVDLRSTRCVGYERVPDKWPGNVSGALMKLERYMTALVDSICENPDIYNTYVEKNLPYSKRKGIIKRSDLNRICPVYRTFDNPKRVVDVVAKMKSLPLWSADKMTLRTYINFWRILYETYSTQCECDPTPKSDFTNKTDKEIFVRYNSKGCEIEGLDLDCEQDYIKWHDENSPYHCMDVAYARIHFYPVNRSSQWIEEDVPVADGLWYLSLTYSVYGFSEDVVNMLETLCNAGIGVVCNGMGRLLRMAQEKDYVRITPTVNKYANDEKVGNEIRLPYEQEGITAHQVANIIEATKWKPLRKVRPIKKMK